MKKATPKKDATQKAIDHWNAHYPAETAVVHADEFAADEYVTGRTRSLAYQRVPKAGEVAGPVVDVILGKGKRAKVVTWDLAKVRPVRCWRHQCLDLSEKIKKDFDKHAPAAALLNFKVRLEFSFGRARCECAGREEFEREANRVLDGTMARARKTAAAIR